MDESNRSRDLLPSDVVVEILVQLPPNARRRFRQVCRLWRDLVDQHTATDMRRRTKIIAVVGKGFRSTASMVDLGTPGSPPDPLWRTDNAAMAVWYNSMSIVGTCNGLVCLCDDRAPGGAITVANPSTGETLCLPPLPKPSNDVHLNYSSRWSWHQTYGFGYNHNTGQYKVVHVPCHFHSFWQPDIVHVFTLGESSWRDVHTNTVPRCRLGVSSFADVDGTLYWLTEHAGKIMAFDLETEHLTCTQSLSAQAVPKNCRLTKLQGRLGVAINGGDSVTVWVLEGERWRCRYMLEAHWVGQRGMGCELATPDLVHGDYFLTLKPEPSSGVHILYGHKISEAARSQDGVLHIRHKDRGQEVARLTGSIYQMFAYVETKEPLGVYNAVL